MRIGGWNIWGKSGNRLRQFTVAAPHEDAALALLREAHPDLEVVSRHIMSPELIAYLEMPDSGIIEWMPANPKDKLTRAGGVPIDQPMTR